MQLCVSRTRQLERRLATAGPDEAAALSADLALDLQVSEEVQRMAALTGEHRMLREGSLADTEEGKALDRDLNEELNSKSLDSLKRLDPLVWKGSVLASYVTGFTFMTIALSESRPEDTRRTARKDMQEKKKAKKALLLAAGSALLLAAKRGFSPAYYDLSVWCRHTKDKAGAEQWFARALEAGEPPALLKENEILLDPVPLPANELQARLDRLYDLALKHCWGALELLALVCRLRQTNSTVKAFAPGVLLLVQDLAGQGFAPAMLALGSYYDTILLAPDAGHRDKRVHHWYDRAAEQGHVQGLIRSIRAGFFGPACTGSVPEAIARLSEATAPDTATGAELKGLLGRLLRQPDAPGHSAGKSDRLLLEAARAGNPHDLCATVRSEIIREDDSPETGCPEHTLLDNRSLARVPDVLFTRGQTMLNYPGHQGEEFRQRAVDCIVAAANKGNKEAACWLADARLRGLYGIPQDIETGLALLQTGLAARHPRAMALEALRQLGWIRGIPGEDHADRAWIRELLGMTASEDDCLGYAALVLLEALEPASAQRQQELGSDLGKAILWARVQADASALYLLGCVAGLHMEDPSLNAVCKYHDALVTRLTGEPGCRDEYAARVATSVFHSARLAGEPRAELLIRLVDPSLDHLARLRAEGKSLEEFM